MPVVLESCSKNTMTALRYVYFEWIPNTAEVVKITGARFSAGN